MRDKLKVHIPI